MKKSIMFLGFAMLVSPLLCLSAESCGGDNICTLDSETISNVAANNLGMETVLHSSNVYVAVTPSSTTTCSGNFVSFNPNSSTGALMFSLLLDAKLNNQPVNLTYKKITGAPYIKECELLFVSS